MDTQMFSGESYEDYFVRLFDNKSEYGLTCDEIAVLLNKASGKTYGESAYRKEYAAFNRGRCYERNQKKIKYSNRILALSDFHYPYQVPVNTFKDYFGAIDTLVLNGDILDCHSLSRFNKEWNSRIMSEMIGCRAYLMELISSIRPKTVVFTYGNHEIRMKQYLMNRVEGDLKELLPDTPLSLIVNDGFTHYDKRAGVKCYYEPLVEDFPDIQIVYNNNWYEKIGKTIFAHPIAYQTSMLKTTEKAVNYFYRTERDFQCVVLAHTHKVGSFIQGNVYMYEQGACCDVKQLTYNEGKLTLPQQGGYLYLCQDNEGNIIPSETKTIII